MGGEAQWERTCTQWAAIIAIVMLSWGGRLCAGPPDLPAGSRTQAVAVEPDNVRQKARDWHLDLGLRIGYTKLASTERELERRLDGPLSLDFLGVFGHPHTPLDSKSEFGLNTVYAGIGRRHNDHIIWTVYAGGGYGDDDTHQRILTANLVTKFDYVALYTGAVVELYPWGTPRYDRNEDWRERLRSSRPFLLTGGEIGYVSAKGRGHFSLAPFTVYKDSKSNRDWLFSLLLGMGWGVPLSDDWSINLSLDHAFHLYRPEEYNTWNLAVTLRYRF